MSTVKVEFPADFAMVIDGIADDQQGYADFKLKHCAVGDRVLNADREEQRLFVLAMCTWLSNGGQLPTAPVGKGIAGLLAAIFPSKKPQKLNRHRSEHVRFAMFELLRRTLPFAEADLVVLLTWAGKQKFWHDAGLPHVRRALENYLAAHELTPTLQAPIRELVFQLNDAHYLDADQRRQAAALKQLGQIDGTSLPLTRGDLWAEQAIADLSQLDQPTQTLWNTLLTTCRDGNGAKPNKKWLKSTGELLDQIDYTNFKAHILRWFPLVDKPRQEEPTDPRRTGHGSGYHHPLYIADANADILRGLVWLCAGHPNKELARALSALAVSAYRKIPGVGPRCVRVGNACVWALGEMPGLDAVGQLAILKTRVKFGTAQKGIEKALDAAALREGIEREEIEEMAVPDYGLTDIGVRRAQLGDFTAELAITGTTSTELRWFKPDGKPQKSLPKQVKEEYSEELNELKQAAKDLQKMVPSQRDRIDGLFLQQKTWDFATWQERYLDHHLVGTLARRIIWRFTKGEQQAAAIWHEGRFVDHADQEITWLDRETTVALWHPIDAEPETVVAWRSWLMAHEIQQPFKQAYREVYLLTDAERTTRVYSNRFAAHILKQHQFNALCGARGWKNQLRLMVDDEYHPAMRYLPEWNLRAEFWIEGAGDQYGTDTTDVGTYLYLTTDQVRFYRTDAELNSAHAGGGGYRSWGQTRPEPIPLEEIPPLVLTEILRDVDLFVGVASIGNDPNWIDGGQERPHINYWHSYAFGDLSETAKTRRETLELLLPALKICDRCSLQEKFLVVRGDLRTYKIHLGSGNILMEPNDQYLCIVPARSAADKATGKLFLPFEGDAVLAIILSKALMLAADTKITDETIVRQIRR